MSISWEKCGGISGFTVLTDSRLKKLKHYSCLSCFGSIYRGQREYLSHENLKPKTLKRPSCLASVF